MSAVLCFDRHAVSYDNLMFEDDQLIGTLVPAGDDIDETSGRKKVRQRTTETILGELQHRAGLVVREQDAIMGVES